MNVEECQAETNPQTVNGLNTFLRHLRASQLLEEKQIEETLRQCGPSADAGVIAQKLLDRELLTRFQFARIVGGRPEQLVMGKYRLLDELGRGAFGRVYKARHTVMNRIVALKVITPELLSDSQIRGWFRREVVANTRLHHPNIVIAFDADEEDGNLFLAMEYVDGPNLEKQVEEEGPLPILLATAILHQTALALQFAHEQGMVHRDIKPANLLLPRSGSLEKHSALVKIVDFGLARLQPRNTPNNQTLDKECGFVGTPFFMSPEQARDLHDVDIRSDLYSLGCTFYYALTGEIPFPGKTLVEIMANHLTRDAIPLEELRADIPPTLVSIVRRLMEKKPENRFQTPEELAGELSFLLAPGTRWSASLNAETNAAETEPALPGSCSEPIAPVPPATVVDADTAPIQDQPRVDTAIAGQKLCLCWQQWFSVVKSMALGKKPRIHQKNYQKLHHELVAAARVIAAAPGGDQQSLAVQIVGLTEPWLTPQTLSSLDRGTLMALFRSCQHVHASIAPARKPRRFFAAAACTAGLGVLVMLALWFIRWPR